VSLYQRLNALYFL